MEMGGLQSGGGTSAVAASAHAGCERFRLTDPFVTGRTRRALAKSLGHPDSSGTIPEARWMRAMTFERLVHSEKFVSELLTTIVGQLGFPRPTAVRRRECNGAVGRTKDELDLAHEKAVADGHATMLTGLALPFLTLEHAPGATPVKPDFAVVCPREVAGTIVGSWLVMGDAKDYERIRSRIDDGRMLKGFLQVALGAESATSWSSLPTGMLVHSRGALAVPRNAFLQPEAVVDQLDDHREEVRLRAQERLDAATSAGGGSGTGVVTGELSTYVKHLEAAYDPRSCVSCSMFSYCRSELRASQDPVATLIEIGVPRLARPSLAPLVAGTGPAPEGIAGAVVGQVQATVQGSAVWTGRRRTDPVGVVRTVELVLVKSDSAALGVHGIAIREGGIPGEEWILRHFAEPQSPTTRRAVMGTLGAALRGILDRPTSHDAAAVHVVVPDRPSIDILATIADSLAGVELSRLRWQRDIDQNRPALTFDGEPATIPEPLSDDERLGVSFLLEEDRARAMSLRSPFVDLRAVLANHLIAGGPAPDAGRLDYLVEWAEASAASPLDHRAVSDRIAGQDHTPGARLSNVVSDELHGLLRRPDRRSRREYRTRVEASLGYRTQTFERALSVLATLPVSVLRPVHRALEADAQTVWLQRYGLQASDLVRFSRTYRTWRDSQVDILDADGRCFSQLACLADPAYAADRATDAGVRELALATVTSTSPLRLRVRSRRLGMDTVVAALHVNGEAVVESSTTTIKIQKGSFKFGQVPVGVLTTVEGSDELDWAAKVAPALSVGDSLVVADVRWIGGEFKSGHEIAVGRPSVDNRAAPRDTCGPSSYAADPYAHQWCCKPHTVAEAEWSDTLAERRAAGELNPQVWPPLVDEERFDVGPEVAVGAPDSGTAPDHLTIDDLD
jgi:hypothetical protein